jgi:asparagine synthase (glutamine-hydrolysing)
VLGRERRQALLARPAADFPEPLPPVVRAELGEAADGLDPVNAHSLLELSLYLADMLLRDTDQMSMAHALEVREPLLDHVLVEAAAAIPGRLKLAPGRQGSAKGLLVDALPVPLPARVTRRAKMGFVLPWERWLRRELKGRVTDVLTDEAGARSAGLNPDSVQGLWAAFLRGEPGIRYTDVLCLFHLLRWVSRHGLRLSHEVGCRVKEAVEGNCPP